MFDREDRVAQQRLNRRLKYVPRLGVIGPGRRTMAQTAFRLGAIGADGRLRRRGLTVESMKIDLADGPTMLRIIRPARPARGILIDIHGGAWAIGSARMDDKLNAMFAERCGLTVVSIDYRLALPRPIAELQRECFAAMRWILSRIEGELAHGPVFVTGESAGGHLALSSLLRLKAHPGLLDRVAGMVLHYGAYDLGGSTSARAAGRETLVLHGPTLERQIRHLLPGLSEEQRRAPALSPLFDDLADLPPALIVVGDIDPLRDENYALADRLREAGNDVTLCVLPAAPHGIIHLRGSYAEKVRRIGQNWLNARIATPERRAPAIRETAVHVTEAAAG